MEIQSSPVYKRIMELQGSPLYRAMNSPELKRLQSLLNDEFWDDEPRHTAAIHAPALEHPAPQSKDAATTDKASPSGLTNPRREPKRMNNLDRAVQLGMEILYKSLGRRATLDELIHHLRTSDESGYIICSAGEEIDWTDCKGERQRATRRAINHHFKKY